MVFFNCFRLDEQITKHEVVNMAEKSSDSEPEAVQPTNPMDEKQLQHTFPKSVPLVQKEGKFKFQPAQIEPKPVSPPSNSIPEPINIQVQSNTMAHQVEPSPPMTQINSNMTNNMDLMGGGDLLGMNTMDNVNSQTQN